MCLLRFHLPWHGTQSLSVNLSAADRARRLSFNGAATFQSRRQELEDPDVRVHLASMGPRPFSRGDEKCNAISEVHSCSELQWGRDLSVAETCSSSVPSAECEHASMGPRPFSRGDKLSGDSDTPAVASMTFQSRRRDAASMGPRPFSRGDLATVLLPLAMTFHRGDQVCCLLQEVFNGAATFQSRRPLQALKLGDPGSCINGAATFQSRRPYRRPTCGLQWGRDLSVAETSASYWINKLLGPRPFRTSVMCSISAKPSFNGAATFQSRRHEGLGIRVQGAPASMGPRPFSRGDSRHFPHRADRASMGPRPFSRGDRCLASRMSVIMLQWGRDLSVAETPQ